LFFTVSGGPYGLEPVLHYVGGSTALLLIFLLPLLWCLPAMLMVLELNSMMPVNGGYYQWVKTALGLKWGFFEGWWSWIFLFVDLAIYPVLFVQYLAFFFPGVEAYGVIVCLALVWGAAGLNILGIVPVGRSSLVLGVAVLVPFLILFISAMTTRDPLAMAHAGEGFHGVGLTAFAMGMFTVMWNYLGWDNGSPYAEEVYKPVRSYLVSMVAAFVLIVAMYAMAIYTASTSGIDSGTLQEQGFPSLGSFVGGWWLGAVVSAGGMASAIGLFLSNLLSVSRIPKAMADDRLLPATLTRLHPTYNVPHVSILLCAVVVSGMVLWTFGDLLIIDVTLYSSALFLEFISLIALRRRAPDGPRPFRIPLNVAGLVAMTAVPAVCLGAALYGLLSTVNIYGSAFLFAIVSILTGPVAWWIVQRRAIFITRR
jgi:amino acid transporter